MRKIREEIVWKEKRFTLLSDKVDKNTMADAEMEAELEGLQCKLEKKGEAAMLRRQEIAAWRPCGSKLLPCVLRLILMQNWFCVDAAAVRLEPKGEAEVPEIIIVSEAVEGTFVNLDGKSLHEEQKGKYQR